jgi:hypothetical protein
MILFTRERATNVKAVENSFKFSRPNLLSKVRAVSSQFFCNVNIFQISGKVDSGLIGRQPEEEGSQHEKGHIR